MIAWHRTVNCARRVLSSFYIWKLSRYENARMLTSFAREKPAPLLAFEMKARYYAIGQVFERGSQPVHSSSVNAVFHRDAKGLTPSRPPTTRDPLIQEFFSRQLLYEPSPRKEKEGERRLRIARRLCMVSVMWRYLFCERNVCPRCSRRKKK